jgi:chitodextrinase
VTVTFNTNETSTGWVSYTAAPTCPCTDVYGASPTTVHAVNLTGLTPDTIYQFQVKAADASGNLQNGPNLSFRTSALPADTVPPAVAITSPGSGNVMGIVQIAATAVDSASAVAQVRFLIDGGVIRTTLSPPYGLAWDTATVPDGLHTISVEAVDTFGNLGTASVIVNVRNTPAVTTPHFVEMDGVNDYVEIADGNALSFGNGVADTPLTFEMWIRPDVLSGKYQLLSKWGETANQEYRLYIAANVIRLDLRDQSAQATVSAYTSSSQAGLAGAWHHLAVSYDGRGGSTAAAGITIYIDGVAVPLTRSNNAAYVAMENLGATLQVGRESAAWKQYDGGLDELRLWAVARTAAQIQAARTTELSGAEPGLVGYWRFNEGSGASSDDSSAGSLAATLNSGAFFGAGGPLTTP